MENKKDESEATPLLQRERESVFYDVPSQSHDAFALSQQQQQQQQQQNGDPNLAAYAMMAAAQYEQAGYHPSDAAAAAASLAVYQQHQQQQQQNMYYGQAGAGGGGGGFPFPPQGGPQTAAGGAPLFYPQTNHHHPHHQSSSQFSIANNQPNQPTRPPRSSRRASPPSPSQTSSPKASREMFQQTTTTTQPPASYMSPPAIGFPWTTSNHHHPLTEDEEKKSQSEIVEVPIPSLQDIFSTDQNIGNYGAIPSKQQQRHHHHHDPQIWNAPALFVPTSTGAGTTSKSPKSKVQAVLVRTSSSGEINQLRKKGKHNNNNSTNSTNNKHHRRSNSDTPLRAAGHRRMGSGDLPPMSHRRNGSDSGSVRSRTLSTGSLPKQQQQQLHRRQASSGSIGTFSSNISLGAVSVVSNIAKSSMFGGVDEATGKVQMHFPFEGVRLVFVDKREDALREGHLYMDGKLTDFEDFEEYTRITNALEEGIQPQWESLDRPTNMCGCDCNHCVGCMGKQELLKNPSYLLAVDSDIYRKVVGEIADAHGMPCGLFFCGHHEDVAHPSIAIAVLVVTILFLSMAYLSFVIEGA